MQNKNILQIILILSPSIVLVALGMDIIIPCIPAIADYFGVEPSIAQWVLSIYFIGTGVGQILIGPLADYFGRRKVILASIAVFVASSIACAISGYIGHLIAARLFQGIGACGATVVVMAVIRDIYEDHTTPQAYSYVNSVTAIAPILAPLLGGNMLVWYATWRSSFYFVTIFGIFAFFINYIFLQETIPAALLNNKQHKTKFIADYKEILSNIEFLGFTYCAITGLTCLFLFFSVSPILMIDNLGITPDVYGYYFGFNFIVYLCGNILSPKLQAITNVDKTMQIGNLTIVIGALLMLAWHYVFGLTLLALMLPSIVMSFGVGTIYGPCMAKAMRPFRHIAGTASASYGAVLYCSCALIVAIVMLFEVESTIPFASTVLFMGVLNILMVRLLSRRSSI